MHRDCASTCRGVHDRRFCAGEASQKSIRRRPVRRRDGPGVCSGGTRSRRRRRAAVGRGDQPTVGRSVITGDDAAGAPCSSFSTLRVTRWISAMHRAFAFSSMQHARARALRQQRGVLANRRRPRRRSRRAAASSAASRSSCRCSAALASSAARAAARRGQRLRGGGAARRQRRRRGRERDVLACCTTWRSCPWARCGGGGATMAPRRRVASGHRAEPGAALRRSSLDLVLTLLRHFNVMFAWRTSPAGTGRAARRTPSAPIAPRASAAASAKRAGARPRAAHARGATRGPGAHGRPMPRFENNGRSRADVRAASTRGRHQDCVSAARREGRARQRRRCHSTRGFHRG